MLLKLVAVCLIVGYSFHNPLPALFISMVIGTNVFQLVSLERLPYFQIGTGLRINASDAFILLFLVIAFHRFYKAKERPLFLNLVFIWIVLVGVSFGAGLLLGDSDLDTGMNLIRYQIGYLSYFFMIALLDTYKRFRLYVKFLIIIVLIAVGIQLVEANLGYRLSLGDMGGVTNVYYSSTMLVNVGGEKVPYTWSRATGPTLLLMFLSLGCLFNGTKIKRYFPLAALAILSYLIALSRTWYIAIAVGICTLFILQRKPKRAIVGAFVIIASLIVVSTFYNSFASRNMGYNPAGIWAKRAMTLQRFGSEQNYIGRINLNKIAVEKVKESPLLGHGPGFVFGKYRTGDLGIMNTLLMYGFVGAGIIFGLYIFVWIQGYKLLKILPSSEEKGYILGILALMVASVAIFFSSDPLSGGGMAVTAAVFIDRISRFHQEGLIGDKSKI